MSDGQPSQLSLTKSSLSPKLEPNSQDLFGDDESCELLDSGPSQQHMPIARKLSLVALRYCSRVCAALQTLSFRHVYQILKQALIPSLFSEESSSSHSERSSALSALDGLRGIACLFVFNYHFLFVFSDATLQGWGNNSHAKWLTQLPILRLPWAGRTMVALFFVISGYVLSFKPLKLMQGRKYDQLASSLASSVFRRTFRLWAPSVIVTFVVMILAHAGAFVAGELSLADRKIFRGAPEKSPPYIPKFGDQLQDWFHSLGQITSPWQWDLRYCHYDNPLWTIRYEFRCSMALYTTQMGVARLRSSYRLFIVAILVFYCAAWGRWEMVLFFGGMLLVEVDLANGLFEQKPLLLFDHGNGQEQQSRARSSLSKANRAIWWAMFVSGLYLASCPPIRASKTPGFAFLISMTPAAFPGKSAHVFWVSMGAIMIVWPIIRLPELQRPLNSRFAQYFGKISFALYLTHSPILIAFGYQTMAWFWSYTGTDTVAGYCLGVLMSLLIVFPIVVWTADLVWRLVDHPCVTFMHWLETAMSVPKSAIMERRP